MVNSPLQFECSVRAHWPAAYVAGYLREVLKSGPWVGLTRCPCKIINAVPGGFVIGLRHIFVSVLLANILKALDHLQTAVDVFGRFQEST